MSTEYTEFKLGSGMDVGIGKNTIAPSFQFHDGTKEVMRITSEGVTVPPNLPTDEAAKAVIEALDVHIKHVVAAHRGALEKAVDELERAEAIMLRECGVGVVNRVTVAAIKEVLK